MPDDRNAIKRTSVERTIITHTFTRAQVVHAIINELCDHQGNGLLPQPQEIEGLGDTVMLTYHYDKESA